MPWKLYESSKDFLVGELERHKEIQNVRINLFGGEPLLESKNIIQFMRGAVNDELKLKEINAHVYGHITTNGYLLNVGTFKELLETGVYYYQITVVVRKSGS